jgi:hypothetical protein
MSTPANTPTPPKPVPNVDSNSAHNVRLWMRQGIREGRLKHCINLDLDVVQFVEIEGRQRGGEGEKHNYSYFIPNCKHRSFVSNISHLSDEMQAEFLRYGLASNPLSCPKDCTFYENYRWGKFKRSVARPFVFAFRISRVLLRVFSRFAWQTQVTLILVPALLLILWKSPNWVPQITALAKALWGK